MLDLTAGTKIPAGCGHSTVMADMDFEAYSEAGFLWDDETKSYKAPKGATKKGLFAVGAVAYSEHPTAEILSLAYDLKDGLGTRIWVPGMPPPQDLFNHFAAGKLVEAWNCGFEYWLWKNVCVARMGWPEIPFWQLRDAAAKSRAFAWPGGLANAAKVSGAAIQKMKEGKRLIQKFCVPRKPTKKDPRRRILMSEDPVDGQLFLDYNAGDIKSEAAVSQLCPDLSPDEEEFWLCTQAMNTRGVALDMATIHPAVLILDGALEKYNTELAELTRHEVAIVGKGISADAALQQGIAGDVFEAIPETVRYETRSVTKASQVQKLTAFLSTQGTHVGKLDAEAVEDLLRDPDLTDASRRALEIRQLVGSAGVKKLYAMLRMASREGRVHDQFTYHAARTGRDGGRDIQPQNLVKNGPKLFWCGGCGQPYSFKFESCPHCGCMSSLSREAKWSWHAVPYAVEVIRTGRLEEVERIFGDALLTLSGCIRGLFVPAPGKDFVASDYSSIEAVVTAVLAGEQWRIDAFIRKEDIYLRSASRITGVSYEEYKQYKVDHGEHHPDRQKIGKPAELGLGFGGWIGAWYQFDSSGNFTEAEIKANINAWRAASPTIPEMWGGQVRGKPWAIDYKELYGFEGGAISAINSPGQCFESHGIKFGVKDDILFVQLLSGRNLTYHKPRLRPSSRPHHKDGQVEITFEGWNSNPKMGRIGWIEIQTYGGRLAENIIQATARDIMAFAVPNLERAGYAIVLRVHDELVAEVMAGTGSIEEFERLMGLLPEWAKDWPIRAAGGWRGPRFRKD